MSVVVQDYNQNFGFGFYRNYYAQVDQVGGIGIGGGGIGLPQPACNCFGQPAYISDTGIITQLSCPPPEQNNNQLLCTQEECEAYYGFTCPTCPDCLEQELSCKWELDCPNPVADVFALPSAASFDACYDCTPGLEGGCPASGCGDDESTNIDYPTCGVIEEVECPEVTTHRIPQKNSQY